VNTHGIINGLRASRLFRRWRKADCGPEGVQINFTARLRDFHEHGCVSPELLLENRSDVTVWVEEATITLSRLEANWQTSNSTGQAIHPIRQNLLPKDESSLSIARAIYDAAGRPQGTYRCFVHSNVRYRVFEEWCVAHLETCRVEMAALAVVSFRRSRWHDSLIDGSGELATKVDKR
jgi:hypothetical protein